MSGFIHSTESMLTSTYIVLTSLGLKFVINQYFTETSGTSIVGPFEKILIFISQICNKRLESIETTYLYSPRLGG